MEYELESTLKIKCTLDSGETIMFNKGGSHQIKVLLPSLESYDQVIIHFQQEEGAELRTEVILSEAAFNRKQWEEIHEKAHQESQEKLKEVPEATTLGNRPIEPTFPRDTTEDERSDSLKRMAEGLLNAAKRLDATQET